MRPYMTYLPEKARNPLSMRTHFAAVCVNFYGTCADKLPLFRAAW